MTAGRNKYYIALACDVETNNLTLKLFKFIIKQTLWFQFINEMICCCFVFNHCELNIMNVVLQFGDIT